MYFLFRNKIFPEFSIFLFALEFVYLDEYESKLLDETYISRIFLIFLYLFN